MLPQWRPDLGYTGPVDGITLSAYCGVGRNPEPLCMIMQWCAYNYRHV